MNFAKESAHLPLIANGSAATAAVCLLRERVDGRDLDVYLLFMDTERRRCCRAQTHTARGDELQMPTKCL